MGLTFIDIIIANPGNPKKMKKLSLLVDSGAIYSVVPKDVLRQLGVKPHSTKTFAFADGSVTYLTSNIDLSVFLSLASRNGGETVTAP